ncbi:plexin-B2-like isoform X1 [Paramisgurnus dabryanus]|uniref:plexin-B2-like isoform X1 n=1 Tax=Paramisgurnus dabryanus TaxID=90735 RepID=UPI0031F45A41
MAWRALAALTMVFCIGSSCCDDSWKQYSSADTINNVVQDPNTGRIYLGAVNAIYQLNSDLGLESTAVTGPKNDNPRCTPPITAQCTDAKSTNNINKLLLVNSPNSTLVVCGSLFRGICSLVNLNSVEKSVYYSDTKAEKTHVASTEETVAVVGVISYFIDSNTNLSVFLVGKGYGGSDSSKLVSTRLLQEHGDMDVFENMIEASTVQASPFAQRYVHDFRHAFKDNGYIYFLFSRTPGTSDSRNITFLARLCENDHMYYSYTELQLNCSSNINGQENTYNKVQAAYLATPGAVMAHDIKLSESNDKVLFVVLSADEDSSRSALCMYPLSTINARLKEVIESCYIGEAGEDGKPKTVYSPYVSKPEAICNIKRTLEMVQNYKCGAEFLPSPLASKPEYALAVKPIYTKKDMLTAVAVAVENDHTVAFLGTSGGDVLKVHLQYPPSLNSYNRISGEHADSGVNKNLFFDSSFYHLYMTAGKKITKVPVQACEQKKDCQSCVSQRDPYCGWCVLEGRCTRKKDCSRGTERNAWLWSPKQTCVTVQAFVPPNISRKKTDGTKVKIYVPSLPSISGSDTLECVFGYFISPATVEGSNVSCALPTSYSISPTPDMQDFVAVPVKIKVNSHIEVASSAFHFYDCAAVVKSAKNTPCIACVTSQWDCQWNIQEHSCSDKNDAAEGSHIIKHLEVGMCPQFELPDPLLIPVGYKTPIKFQGKNLDFYLGKTLQIGTELMKHVGEVIVEADGSKYSFVGYQFDYDKEPEVNVTFYVKDKDTERMIDSTLTVVLYNCSVHREDCSLCKNAEKKYNCVWCDNTKSCIYRDLCKQKLTQCPAPTITDIIPRYGPMDGQISVTIKGSNLGIKQEDIKSITVASVPCTHQPERYSVSTSVVCEIGPFPPSLPHSLEGPVEVEVDGGRRGLSTVKFTYRDPDPLEVTPSNGPQAGGTLITITGENLETASKDDISILVGGEPCEVVTFGQNITCKTGPYKGQKIPSEKLTVSVKYGKVTVKEVKNGFEYSVNPKIKEYFPQSSFVCGGRNITVKGSGFGQVQRATMQVLPSSDDSPVTLSNVTFVEEFSSKNETILKFLSPKVPEEYIDQPLKLIIKLDNLEEDLTNFLYHPDPTFTKVVDKTVTEGSIIDVNGHGFTRAMTAREAQAYVGDELCVVTILENDKLFLTSPSRPPKSTSLPSKSTPSRHRRDTSSEAMDLLIKFGYGEWTVGSVRFERKYEVPLYIIIPVVLIPMVLSIAMSMYCYSRKH